MVQLLLNTFRADGSRRPTSARVAEIHTIRALPLCMGPPPARSSPFKATAAAPSGQPPLQPPRPHPPRPESARVPTRGHRPLSARPPVRRPESSTLRRPTGPAAQLGGVRQPGSSARHSRESVGTGPGGAGSSSPGGAMTERGAASLGGRATDSWVDADEQALAPATALQPPSSTFLTDLAASGSGGSGGADALAMGLLSAMAPAPAGASAPKRRDKSLPPLERRSARDRKRAALEGQLALSAEEYVDLAFEATSDALFQFDSDAADRALTAARDFDTRQVGHATAVRGHLVNLEVAPTSQVCTRGAAHGARAARHTVHARRGTRCTRGAARSSSGGVRGARAHARHARGSPCATLAHRGRA
jgi:hypothetical protein